MLYKVLKPIAYGGRIEKGQTIKMTEETANSIGKDYLRPVGESDEVIEEEVVVNDKPLEEMSKVELIDKAIEMGLSKAGSKADILERIELAESGETEESDEEETEE